MELKKGGLLERIMSNPESDEDICETCGSFTQVSKTALGCVAHDKLIMPEYIPYRANGNK